MVIKIRLTGSEVDLQRELKLLERREDIKVLSVQKIYDDNINPNEDKKIYRIYVRIEIKKTI